MSKIKTRVKYGVGTFEQTFFKLQKIRHYGKSSIPRF